jgi:cell division septal protein FtsQ
MWFRRKQKNRRLGREFVLDVKLRSSQVRAARTRMAAVALGVVFAAVLGVCLVWRGGEWAMDRLVYGNKSFAIEEVDVRTDGVIAVDQLRRWAAVRTGDNLFALDLARVKRDLELVTQVQTASVERILPHTLRIRIAEREPVAQLNVPHLRAGGGVETAQFQLDGEGYVMVELNKAQRAIPVSQFEEQLPAITGINLSEIQAGRRIESPQVQAALKLIEAFDRSPMAGLADLKRIDVSAGGVLVVTTGQGSEVTFGLGDPEQQLLRWRAIFDTGQRFGKAIATLDLAIPNNIPARWLEASSVPPAAPRLPRTPHNRRRNV